MQSNWAGNVTFRGRLHRPTDISELQRLVAASPRLRAIGTAHSFNRIADTEGELVSLDAMSGAIEVDEASRTVSVPAATRYGELAEHLHARGYALHNLASLPHLSVAGAVATGTHGSGQRNGSLATAVSGIEMVAATGDAVTLRRGDADFDGVVVGLGALGIVTRLHLDMVPTFDLAQDVYDDLPRELLEAQWQQILADGYSVSLFTDWTGPSINQVWRKRTPDASSISWSGARPADGPRHPIAGMPTENCTEQCGVPGPWHTRLPHFRREFAPSHGDELQSEYLLARADLLDALEALDPIRTRIAPLLLISEFRTVASDEMWMSPAYHRDSAAIHFTWRPEADAVAGLLDDIEAALAPFRARPHWGKVFGTDAAVIETLYDRLPDFVALLARFDPAGKFRNEFIDRYFSA